MVKLKEIETAVNGKHGPFTYYKLDKNKDNFFKYLEYIVNVSGSREPKLDLIYETDDLKKIYVVKPFKHKISTHKIRKGGMSNDLLDLIINKNIPLGADITKYINRNNKAIKSKSYLQSRGILSNSRLICPLIKIDYNQKKLLEKLM